MGSQENVGVVAIDKKSGAQILVRGDLVKLEFEDGRMLEIPDDWGILHDPLGKVLDPCDLRLAPYVRGRASVVPETDRMRSVCDSYFGRDTQVREGTVEIPNGPWKDVGRIAHVYYARYGNLKGLYRHPFKTQAPQVLLQQNARGQYRLTFPSGCIIDSHGFVWP
jgi:hypothetical protein